MDYKYGYLYVILSLLIGGGIGYFLSDYFYQKEVEDIKQSYISRCEHLEKALYTEKVEFCRGIRDRIEHVRGEASFLPPCPATDMVNKAIDEVFTYIDDLIPKDNKKKEDAFATTVYEDLSKMYRTPVEEQVDYSNYSSKKDSEEKIDEPMVEVKPISERSKEPYIIAPNDFDELADEGYETIELLYFEDGVLCDDRGNIPEDPDASVGSDWMNKFGEFDEPDSVYIRNESLMVDYAIFQQVGTYQDYMRDKPPAPEGG